MPLCSSIASARKHCHCFAVLLPVTCNCRIRYVHCCPECTLSARTNSIVHLDSKWQFHMFPRNILWGQNSVQEECRVCGMVSVSYPPSVVLHFSDHEILISWIHFSNRYLMHQLAKHLDCVPSLIAAWLLSIYLCMLSVSLFICL